MTFMGGPNFSFPLGKMKAESSVSTEIFNFSTSEKMDIDSTVLFGITVGMEVSYPVGSGAIVGGIRYINDFTKLKVKDFSSGESVEALTRRALTFSAGYQISF